MSYLRTSTGQLSGRNPQRGHLTSTESEAASAFDFFRGSFVGIFDLHAELRPLGIVGTIATLDGHEIDVVHRAVLAHGDSFRRCAAIGTAIGLLGGMVPVPATAVIFGAVVKRGPGNFDTGRDRRSALLISFSASITFTPGDAVLARTLATGLVTDFPRGAHGMAVAGLAGLFASDGLASVSKVAFFAVVAVSAGRVVLAFQAHAP